MSGLVQGGTDAGGAREDGVACEKRGSVGKGRVVCEKEVRNKRGGISDTRGRWSCDRCSGVQ